MIGNYIGTDKDGACTLNSGSVCPLGNFLDGVIIEHATNNKIGGTSGVKTDGACAGQCNIIAHNNLWGVIIRGAVAQGNAILGNSIFGNGLSPAIDLNHDGATLNDEEDGDEGPNKLQNYPDISKVELKPNGNLAIEYLVDSIVTNSAYPLRIEFFKENGKTFIGSDSYPAKAATERKSVVLGKAATLGVTKGDRIVATATDKNGNTSEFTLPQIECLDPLKEYQDAGTECVYHRVQFVSFEFKYGKDGKNPKLIRKYHARIEAGSKIEAYLNEHR